MTKRIVTVIHWKCPHCQHPFHTKDRIPKVCPKCKKHGNYR